MVLKTQNKGIRVCGFLETFESVPLSPAKNQRSGVMENSRDPLSSASLCCH